MIPKIQISEYQLRAAFPDCGHAHLDYCLSTRRNDRIAGGIWVRKETP